MTRRWRKLAVTLIPALALVLGLGLSSAAQAASSPTPQPSGASTALVRHADGLYTPGGKLYAKRVATPDITYYQWQKYSNHGWCIADPSGGGSGTKLVLWQCQTEWWFGWTTYTISSGPWTGYYIFELGNGTLCLDDHASGNHQVVTAYTCNETGSQAWQIEFSGGAPFQFANGGDTSACLSDANNRLVNGNTIEVWDCAANDYDYWNNVP